MTRIVEFAAWIYVIGALWPTVLIIGFLVVSGFVVFMDKMTNSSREYIRNRRK